MKTLGNWVLVNENKRENLNGPDFLKHREEFSA